MIRSRQIIARDIRGDQITRNGGNCGPKNRLLEALLRQRGERLRRSLERVFLPDRKVLWEPGGSLSWLYFPQSSVVAIVNEFEDGTTAQVATVGSEGVVPVTPLLGGGLALDRHVVQVAGSAMRVRASTVLGTPDSALRCPVLAAFVQEFVSRVLQSVACNALHSVEERCARWLLTTADSTDSSNVALTHEFLAELLGVARPTVSVATRALREAGLIRSSRGNIEIVDRGGLERASCECYMTIRHKQEQMFAPTPE
jgi:CRP-like cAMP-binding protein